MKKFNKLLALLVLISLLSTFLIGCSLDEIKVLNAMAKSASIKSMESKTNLTFRFEADGFSEKEDEVLQTIAPLLNNMKVSVTQKTSQNEDKSIIKAQMDAFFEIGGVSTNMGVWVDSNIAGEKPVLKEIVRVPAIATIAFPSQFKGKQYFTMDMADLPGMDKEFITEYKQILNFENNFAAKFIEFLKDSASQFNPGFEFITYKGGKSVNGEFLTFYEMKLDDTSFKALAKYTVTNLLQNEKTVELIKELLTSATKLSSASNPLGDKYVGQTEKMFEMMQLNTPQNIEMINKIFEALENVKIVGDNGIVISYGINNDGYIANESATMDFSIDMKSVETAIQKFMGISALPVMSDTSGVIKFGIDYNTEISNINRDLQISFPELTEKNSFSFTELNEVLNPSITDSYGFAPYDYANQPVDIMIDEKILGSNVRAKVENGIILVPLRSVSEALGAKVVSNTKNQTISVQKGDTKIVFKTNSAEATVNGQKVRLYSPMISIDKKNYVPVNVLSDNFDARIQWNKKTNTLIITSDYIEYDEEEFLY